MKISVFPKINFHPTQEQKPKMAVYSSKPHYPETREFANEEQLFELVTQYGWSPSIFTGYRQNATFSFCDVLALDIDDGMRLQDAERICKDNSLCALISPSPSFTEEHHKFRIIFPLVRSIHSPDQFTATWQKLAALFPQVDEQCKDLARFFFPCKPDPDHSVWIDGELLEPAEVPEKVVDRWGKREYNLVDTDGLQSKDALILLFGELPEKVSEAVAHFLENAHTGLSGEWTNSLNACCFALAAKGVDEDKIWEVTQRVAPEPLDDSDEYQIERAIRDGKEAYADRQLELATGSAKPPTVRRRLR